MASTSVSGTPGAAGISPGSWTRYTVTVGRAGGVVADVPDVEDAVRAVGCRPRRHVLPVDRLGSLDRVRAEAVPSSAKAYSSAAPPESLCAHSTSEWPGRRRQPRQLDQPRLGDRAPDLDRLEAVTLARAGRRRRRGQRAPQHREHRHRPHPSHAATLWRKATGRTPPPARMERWPRRSATSTTWSRSSPRTTARPSPTSVPAAVATGRARTRYRAGGRDLVVRFGELRDGYEMDGRPPRGRGPSCRSPRCSPSATPSTERSPSRPGTDGQFLEDVGVRGRRRRRRRARAAAGRVPRRAGAAGRARVLVPAG